MALNTALVFSPGYSVRPEEIQMGLAALPGLRLALAFTGSIALCIVASLLSRFAFMNWMRWLGEHSIVVYLSFSIPMAATRLVLIKLGLIENTGLLSLLVLLAALVSPIVLYWLIQRTGLGKFLFERPVWAHLPGTPGSRSHAAPHAAAPAE